MALKSFVVYNFVNLKRCLFLDFSRDGRVFSAFLAKKTLCHAFVPVRPRGQSSALQICGGVPDGDDVQKNRPQIAVRAVFGVCCVRFVWVWCVRFYMLRRGVSVDAVALVLCQRTDEVKKRGGREASPT